MVGEVVEGWKGGVLWLVESLRGVVGEGWGLWHGLFGGGSYDLLGVGFLWV